MSEKEQANYSQLPTEDQESLVEFFELLLKVDIRVNSHLYDSRNSKND